MKYIFPEDLWSIPQKLGGTNTAYIVTRASKYVEVETGKLASQNVIPRASTSYIVDYLCTKIFRAPGPGTVLAVRMCVGGAGSRTLIKLFI